jgi:hypothetical protein
MKIALKMAALLAAGLAVSGCAGIVEIKLPREFKGKKQVEDPPLSRLAPAPARKAA